MIKTIVLNEDREKSLLRHHPWVFSKAIQKEDDDIENGSIVDVLDSNNNFLARGFYSKNSQIKVRVLSFTKENIDKEFFKKRIINAIEARSLLIENGNDGVRLIASEGDFLPGLIVDKYNDVLSLSISTKGMDKVKNTILDILKELYPNFSIYERSDVKTRKKEGLPLVSGLLYGKDIDDTLFVLENNLVKIPIDVKNGHKTGGYLDQRASRKRLYEIAKNKSVLNCFSYTGGFGLMALKGGAKSVHNVDVSDNALQKAKEGVVFNHLDPGRCKFIKKDVFLHLRDLVKDGIKYDIVVLDPPKFIESANTLKKGCRGYQDINRLAMQIVADGGILLTFSCSGLMDLALFQKIVADAAIEANVDAQLISTLRQDVDHVVALPCPESFYLKGLEIRIKHK